MALFVTLVVLRTYGVAQTMWMLGDQIRDWRVALGSLTSLPLDGPASAAGGTALGPIYYWLLWLIRVTIGPWFDNLPHAGAYGLALLHAGADVYLFFAVRRASGSSPLALAILLLLATAPYDLALSSTVWSPPLAASVIKVALGMFIVHAHTVSRWRIAAIVGVAWLAVQTHSSSILVFLPLAAWFVARDLWTKQWRSAFEVARLIVEIVLLLQVPYIVDRLMSDTPRGAPTMIAEGIGGVVADPLSAEPAVSFARIAHRIAYLWVTPFDGWWLPWVLGVAAIVTLVVVRRGAHWVFAAILPLAIGVVGFSAWTRPMEAYWFFGLAPSVAMLIVAAVAALPEGRVRHAAALAALGLVLYAQPPRLAATRTIHRMPEYGALIAGTRAIAHRTAEIRAIHTSFELPATADPTFPFVCMGGNVTPDAPFDAVIDADGSVTFRSR